LRREPIIPKTSTGSPDPQSLAGAPEQSSEAIAKRRGR
jgi:hypothetical protein